jgi:phospholipid/cholesterol/gamma-HCH transport system permease protein
MSTDEVSMPSFSAGEKPGKNTSIMKTEKVDLRMPAAANPIKSFLTGFTDFLFFTGRLFRSLFRPPHELAELLRQCYKTGNMSMPLVGITAFIMGLVLTIQSRPSLITYGAESLLPGIISISVIKEIGPVLTALVCAGKISSRMGAELGAMRVTEQIDAMEASGINPFNYLVVTRVLATTLMLPLLIVFADGVALVASYLAVNIHGNISLTRFFSLALSKLAFSDILPAMIKSFLFGFVIGIIGCYKGFTARSGTAGVGRAANSAVVAASMAIFVLDMLTVQITDLI